MRKIATLTLCLFASMAGAEQAFEFTDFTSVEVKEGVSARVIVGPTFSVTARAVDGDLAHLNVNQFGQWIVFSRDARWGPFPNWRQDHFEVVVTLPALTEVKALDHAAVTAVGAFSDALRAETDGNSQLILQLGHVGALTLVAQNGSSLIATGTCDTLVVNGKGGDIAATDLFCESIEIDAQAEISAAFSPDAQFVNPSATN